KTLCFYDYALILRQDYDVTSSLRRGALHCNGLGPKEKLTILFLVQGNPQHALKDKGVIDSGCSRHMIGNMSYLSDFEELNGGYVAFGCNPKGGKIFRKGKIRTRKLDFDDVCFVKELKFNLFSVSQMCDKKNSVLFTDTECLVLSLEFKLPDENQVLLIVPRENNMYNVNLKNIVPSGDLTCLFAKATLDESNLWHRRLAHINFKTINKLVKGNFVRGLPSKVFENDHICVACKKGKQHRASCKTKPVSSVNQPLYRLHMDLFRPTFVKSLNKNSYCLVVTDDYSRTLIEAARTMVADLILPILFWAEAVNTACYVQNRVLVIEPQNKTPYELLHGRTPNIGFMRPFGCSVTILNTLDFLGKFDGKVDEGFLVRYSISSKAFRVFNSRTRIVQKTLHVNFLENKPNVAGEEIVHQYMLFLVWSSGSTNPYNTIRDAAFDEKEPEFERKKHESEVNVSPNSSAYINEDNAVDILVPIVGQLSPNNTNTFSATGPSNVVASLTHRNSSCIEISQLPDDPNMLELEDITYSDDEEDVGAEANFNILEISITVSLIPTTRVYKDHPVTQVIGDLSSATQTKSLTRVAKDQCGLSQINNKDFHTYKKLASTPIDTEKPLLKDPNGEDVDVHTYRSMISSLMYLTSSRPDIMFAVCACARFQVTPTASHLHAVKRIFRYFKGKPHLRLWYPKDSPFDLVAYSDSDYAGASLDRKSTTEGCQFLGCRLIFW
nr:ribonuclease H-like domain-containing protein [Tanacetum cinerariifolium]